MARDEEIIDAGRLGEIRKRLGKNLPDSWELTTLGDAFKWGSGGTPKRTDPRFYGGDIPWLIIGDLNDGIVSDSETTITEDGLNESSAKWVEPGSVLLAMYGSIGKLGIAGRRLTTNQAIAFTKPDPVDVKYLFYYLMYTRGDLASLGKGATQKNISQTVIKAFPFVLAPQDQQKRIVAEIEKQFSRLDEAVANLKRVKANLKRYKAAVLKDAVEGRLVETEAELARREGRSYETGEQLLQRILETRRSQWQGKGKYKEPVAPDTANLPELPEGWAWVTLEQLCPIFVDSAHRTPKYGAYGIPAVGPRDVVGGALRLNGARVVDDNEFSIQTERRIPQPGDIVYSRELSLGWGAVVPDASILCLSQGMCLFRPDERVSLSYFVHALNGPEVRKQATSRATGSAHPHLNLGEIKRMLFTLPPYGEQQRIALEVDRRVSLLREIAAQVDANLHRAERLRQVIFSSIFSGPKLTVDGLFGEFEKTMGELAI